MREGLLVYWGLGMLGRGQAGGLEAAGVFKEGAFTLLHGVLLCERKEGHMLGHRWERADEWKWALLAPGSAL